MVLVLALGGWMDWMDWVDWDGKLGYWAATNANRRNFIINKIK